MMEIIIYIKSAIFPNFLLVFQSIRETATATRATITNNNNRKEIVIKFKPTISPEFLLVFCSTRMTYSYCSLSNCNISNMAQMVGFPDFLFVFCSARMSYSHCCLSNCHNSNMSQIAIFPYSIEIHALPLSKSFSTQEDCYSEQQSDANKSPP